MATYRLTPFAIAACLLCGCGTMANLDGRRYALISRSDEVRPKILGGVQKDIGWIASGNPVGPIFVLDLPASLVGDVITLSSVREAQTRWDEKKEEIKLKPHLATPDPYFE